MQSLSSSVVSHLSVCFRTWYIFSHGSDHLDICEHYNHAWFCIKTIGRRWLSWLDCKRTLGQFACGVIQQ